MNRDELRSQAASRRSGEAATAPVQGKWHCHFCKHDFTHETVFMKHRCRERERLEELRSPVGQAAYSYYTEWMRVQKHSIPPIETFAESKFYTVFVRFAEYAKRTNLPNVPAFIKLMVETGKIPPGLWCRDNVYAMYLQAFDAAVPPTEQFLKGVDELEQLAIELKVPLWGIFPAIGFETLLDLIAKRKLTFWLLLASDRFKTYLKTLDPAERDFLANAFGIEGAILRINQEQYLIREFAAALKEIGL